MVGARRGGDAEIRTEEGRTKLGHEFLHAVSVITKAVGKVALTRAGP